MGIASTLAKAGKYARSARSTAFSAAKPAFKSAMKNPQGAAIIAGAGAVGGYAIGSAQKRKDNLNKPGRAY